MEDHANDAGVEKARAAAEEYWKARNGALDGPLTVQAVQKQVVAGARHCLPGLGTPSSDGDVKRRRAVYL